MKYFIAPERRLLAYEEDGSQDGYIPQNARPATPEEVQAIQNPPLALTDVKARLTGALQKLLDDTAKARGYDSMLSLVSYVASTNEAFAAEAAAGIAYRDAMWAYGNEIANAVEAGAQGLPNEQALLANAPVITWS